MNSTGTGIDWKAAKWGAWLGCAVAGGMVWWMWGLVGVRFDDPDDAMRLAQIRDLLAGQSWADWTQHRMQQPEGLPMHWSRVVDLPVAALILSLKWLLGQPMAERVAMTAWPTALVPVLVGAASGLAPGRGSAPWKAVGAAACCASLVLLSRFMPGRIDHHAAMTTLTAVAGAAMLGGRNRRGGLLAGACTALCLAIGLEDLVALTALAAGSAFLWMRGEEDYARGYAEGLAASTLICAAVFIPSDMWTTTYCDAMSRGWIAPILAGSALFALAARMTPKGREWAAIPGIAGVTALLFLLEAPQCLHGPFASVPDVIRIMWLDHVAEMQGVSYYMNGRPDVFLAFEAAPLVAAVILFERIGANRDRTGSIAYLAFHLCAAVVGMLFVRNAGLAMATAAPVVASALGLGRLAPRLLAVVVVTVPVWLSFTQMASQSKEAAESGARAKSCSAPSEMAALAREPVGRVMTPIDMGAFVLSNTPHATVAGGYHRAERGLIEVIATLANHADGAGQAVAISGVDYVAWCAYSVELKNYSLLDPESFGAQLDSGALPAWLAPIKTEGPVRYARVLKGRLPRG